MDLRIKYRNSRKYIIKIIKTSIHLGRNIFAIANFMDLQTNSSVFIVYSTRYNQNHQYTSSYRLTGQLPVRSNVYFFIKHHPYLWKTQPRLFIIFMFYLTRSFPPDHSIFIIYTNKNVLSYLKSYLLCLECKRVYTLVNN